MLTASPRPDVVSNSWVGSAENPFYNDVVSAWRSADIIPVFALGNSGPSCGSAYSPGDQLNLISVGATDVYDAMASFSSRGPGPQGLQKPEVSAPGANIVSAGIDGTSSYTTKSGTSMATPHVAGAVALLRAANPNITYAQVLAALTAVDNVDRPPVSYADRDCGSTDAEWPNMAFGHGRVNIGKAL
jgi:subtilisin family serine protease